MEAKVQEAERDRNRLRAECEGVNRQIGELHEVAKA